MRGSTPGVQGSNLQLLWFTFLSYPPHCFQLSCCQGHHSSEWLGSSLMSTGDLVQLSASSHPFIQLKRSWTFPKGILLGNAWKNTSQPNNTEAHELRR